MSVWEELSCLPDLQRDQQVWDCVNTLPPRDAMVIIWHYQQDHSVQEIADFLDYPTGTVKTILHRTRGKLKLLFERQGIEGNTSDT